ncbi:MAG: pyrroloquinoline quinone-dependent dehydrogenase [Chromatiales bacterium]|jgi:quinoprotein glucose dehydrogenase|nr:pyrroloquinoline quinone-dependent dehydrogenase [Chromatiales bacterium]
MRLLPPVYRVACAFLLLPLLLAGPVAAQGWLHHGGDEGGSRYSSLDQVNRDNVGRLKLAWQYRTGAVAANPQLKSVIDFQVTPTLLPPEAGGHLVLCDPFSKIIALDPVSGAERWTYDPQIDKTPYAGRFKCKGVAYWQDAEAPADAACAHRLYVATSDKRLIAVDARDGKLCAGFGTGGTVDVEPLLAATLPTDPESLRGAQLMSPPAVVSGIVAVSSTANKFKSTSALNGAIRGFDARTGELRWTFDTLVRDPATGLEPTPMAVGGANTWVPMTVDNERDLLFIPTASPAPNYWGVHRPGDNRYANSVIAVRGSTGQVVWHFQTLHHDVWDRDVGSPPMAVTLTKDGQAIPALIQLVKTGMVFTFNRETGDPVFPIEERPVPTDTDVVGEKLSPTQPFPTAPPVLVKNTITPDDAWGFTAFDRNACRRKIAELRHGSHYEPIMTTGTLLFPQPGGGPNWGGGAFDPARNILITPVSQIPYYVKLIPREQVDPEYAKRPEAGAPMQKPGFLGDTPYGVQQGPLMSPSFTPCTKPPWNMLVAVDMAKGEILWKVPFGRLDKLMPVPIPLNFGAPTAGGPIVTAGGLIFIGATPDNRVHAFDIESGEEVWTFRTPTSAMATPMTYSVGGKQFVVFAVGGHSWYDAKGVDDYVMAFALPD